jgi:hypothetical protein
MSVALVYEDQPQGNPLDVIEQVVVTNDWVYDRRADDELAVEVPGQWCNYSLYFAWREDMAALHFTAAFEMKVPPHKRPPLYELLAIINEKLWLGHFGLWEEEGAPMYRHTLLLRGASSMVPEQVEDLVDIAIGECERFYPSFQFVVWGGKSARDAVSASLLETVGEA